MKFGDRCPLAGDLARFQLGSLSDSDIDEIGRHLEDCLECQLKLAATDPLILAIGLAFILATIFRVATIAIVRQAAHLRPPLRGPPLTA